MKEQYHVVGEHNGYRVEVSKWENLDTAIWYADNLGRLLQYGVVEVTNTEGEIAYKFEVNNGYYLELKGYITEGV